MVENLLSKEDLVSMDRGCVCCSLRNDIVKALKELQGRGAARGAAPDDCILLETTGLADPAPVAFTFFANSWISANYRLDSILCLVDAQHLRHVRPRCRGGGAGCRSGAAGACVAAPASTEAAAAACKGPATSCLALPAHPAARCPRLAPCLPVQHLEDAGKGDVNEAVNQIAFADIILLNKIDLVSPEELQVRCWDKGSSRGGGGGRSCRCRRMVLGWPGSARGEAAHAVLRNCVW